jgi:two-component system OmpR family response regulator
VGPCILVVEDEAMIQLVLEADLGDAGFSVIAVGGAVEAIARLEAGADGCHAVVTDINLSDGSGWDVARRARELNPTMPVVYMTGDSAHEWPIKGVPQSILVAKPFAPVQIVNAVAQLLNDQAKTVTAPQA